MGAIEETSLGVSDAPMEHHLLQTVLLYTKVDTIRQVVGLGWYTPEKISGVT
jgi:hypothetical protein